MPAIHGKIENSADYRKKLDVNRFSTLSSSLEVDVAIFGNGLTAIQSALKLHKSGYRVALLAPGAFIEEVDSLRSVWFDILEPSNHSKWYREFGLKHGSVLAAAYRASIEEFQSRSSQYSESHFSQVPGLNVAEKGADLMAIERECATGRALGGDCWFERETPLPYSCAGASRDNLQGKLLLQPLLSAMVAEFQMLGGEVFEHSPCVAPPSLGRRCEVFTERGKLTAKDLIFTGRLPFATSAELGALTPLHSYQIAAKSDKPIGDAIYILGQQPRRIAWAADRRAPSRLIIRADYFGDEIESQSRRFDELCCYAASRFSLNRVDARWSQHRLVAPDELPIVGRMSNVENIFIAVGMGTSESPWGMECGNLLANLIQGETSPVAAYFDPNRLKRTRPHRLAFGVDESNRARSGAAVEEERGADQEGSTDSWIPSRSVLYGRRRESPFAPPFNHQTMEPRWPRFH